jgi:hypothetical protein
MPGHWVVIKTIEIKKSSIKKTKMEMEVGTYDKNPVHMKKADIKYIGGEFLTMFPEYFFEHFKVLPERVYEKFTEDSDAIHDMGIGISEQIKKFMKNDIEEYEDDDDATTKNINIILGYSLAYEKEDFVKYLLERGAKINENPRVISWFHFACKYGHPGMIKLMLKYKFDFHGNPIEGHEKGLRIAIANNNLPIVEILIEAGADIHAALDKPLRTAVANDHIEILKYLHEHGAKFTLALIHLAVESKAVNVMKYMQDSIRENRKKKLKKFFHIKESLYERFEEDSDPITDMGIGMDHYVYNIEKEGFDSYNFETNNEKIAKFIKKCIPDISKNEIERFVAFTMSDIYDNIDADYFELGDLDKLDQQIGRAIIHHSRSWMGRHSDQAMKSFRR